MMHRRRPNAVGGAAALAVAAGLLISGCTATAADGPPDQTTTGTVSSPAAEGLASASSSATPSSSPSTAAESSRGPKIPTEPSKGAVAYARLSGGEQYLGLVKKVTPGENYLVRLFCDTGTVRYQVVAPGDGHTTEDYLLVAGEATCPVDGVQATLSIPRADPGVTLPNDGKFQIQLTDHDDDVTAFLEIAPDPAG